MSCNSFSVTAAHDLNTKYILIPFVLSSERWNNMLCSTFRRTRKMMSHRNSENWRLDPLIRWRCRCVAGQSSQQSSVPDYSAALAEYYRQQPYLWNPAQIQVTLEVPVSLKIPSVGFPAAVPLDPRWSRLLVSCCSAGFFPCVFSVSTGIRKKQWSAPSSFWLDVLHSTWTKL